jgi:hypothetical protein
MSGQTWFYIQLGFSLEAFKDVVDACMAQLIVEREVRC